MQLGCPFMVSVEFSCFLFLFFFLGSLQRQRNCGKSRVCLPGFFVQKASERSADDCRAFRVSVNCGTNNAKDNNVCLGAVGSTAIGELFALTEYLCGKRRLEIATNLRCPASADVLCERCISLG